MSFIAQIKAKQIMKSMTRGKHGSKPVCKE